MCIIDLSRFTNTKNVPKLKQFGNKSNVIIKIARNPFGLPSMTFSRCIVWSDIYEHVE